MVRITYLNLHTHGVRSDFQCASCVSDRNRFYSPKTHRSRRPILLADEDMKRLTEFRRRTGCAGEDDWLYNNEILRPPLTASGTCRRQRGVAAFPKLRYGQGLVRKWQQIWQQVGRRGHCNSCKPLISQGWRGTQVAQGRGLQNLTAKPLRPLRIDPRACRGLSSWRGRPRPRIASSSGAFACIAVE